MFRILYPGELKDIRKTEWEVVHSNKLISNTSMFMNRVWIFPQLFSIKHVSRRTLCFLPRQKRGHIAFVFPQAWVDWITTFRAEVMTWWNLFFRNLRNANQICTILKWEHHLYICKKSSPEKKRKQSSVSN